MSIGITEKEQNIIIDILKEYKDYSFYFYGSRIKGTWEKTSDLDILIKGRQEVPLYIIDDLKQKFDDSNLPYIVNFSDYYLINKDFYKRIEKDLFPYDWKEYKLGDLISIKHGYAFKGDFITSEDNGVVLVTPGNFAIGGGFQENKCKFYIDTYPEDYVLKENDLIVTMTDLSKEGDTLGYSAKIPKSNNRIYLHNQRIGLRHLSIFHDACVLIAPA